jgi:ankyrin repeat protein
MACGNQENESMNKVMTKYIGERHDPNLDQQIQPLLNQYFAVMAHLQEQDSAELVLFGSNMIILADSLSQQDLSLDTATEYAAIQGLTNIQYEMSAILMESNPAERIKGAQMLSLQWIDFLAAIGYQKQTIYIFSDKDENHWMGLKNKANSPFLNGESVIYSPIQVLQELK